MQQMFLFVSPASVVSDKHFVINKVYLYDHVDQIPRLHFNVFLLGWRRRATGLRFEPAD